MKHQTYRLYSVITRNLGIRQERGAMLNTFDSREKLRLWVMEARIHTSDAKFVWRPAFHFMNDDKTGFIRGTNIRTKGGVK